MAIDPGLIRLIDETAEFATHWHEVASALRPLADSPEHDAFILASAFDYMLKTDRRSDGRPAETGFAPMLVFESGESVPPRLENVATRWLETWAEAASSVESPLASARLHDLLVEAKYSDLPGHARSAVEAYLAAAGRDWERLYKADSLVRALAISRQLNLSELASQVLDAMVDVAAEALAASTPEPGVVFELLEALQADRDTPPQLDDLITGARDAYKEAYLVEAVVALERRRARDDPERLRTLERERVQAWLDEAGRASGLVRVVHLETAARIAQEVGASDLRAEALRQLQAVPTDELELQSVSAEVTIPEEAIAAYLAPFTEAGSVRELLVALISHPPATGDVRKNRADLEKARIEFPLQYLFPRVKLGGDGLPRWRATTDDEKEDGDLAHHEDLNFQILSDLIARGLWLGGERLQPSKEDVEQFLREMPNIPDSAARLLASAFIAFWQEDWTTSLFLAVPCVEAVSRHLVLKLERGVYQTQRGRRPGQYPGLGVLTKWMREDGLDESWYRYIWTVMCSPAGLNLRNELAHGFVSEGSPRLAAAALHIATFIGSLDVVRAEVPTTARRTPDS